jgi:hypothetical protein
LKEYGQEALVVGHIAAGSGRRHHGGVANKELGEYEKKIPV